jgi:hypothetical protein
VTTQTKTRQSRAQRAAAQAEADAVAAAEAGDIEPTAEAVEAAAVEQQSDDAQPEPEQPAEPKPPKPPTATEKRRIVFAALAKAAGDLVENWDDDRVTAEFARATLAHRMSYVPSALDQIWDSRLGPVPAGRGKIAQPAE